MKLYFKQRIFSWLDSYDIYDESGNIIYVVKGKLAWGHKLVIYNAYEEELGIVEQEVLTLLPKFYFYAHGQLLGTLKKELSFLTKHYNIDFNGWHVEGQFMEWDYTIKNGTQLIATISKDLFHLSDHYVIDVENPKDALYALMIVLAIDAEKCSRN